MRGMIFIAAVAIALAMPSVCVAANAIQSVPEPATGLLLVLGGAGAVAYRKFRGPRS
jgi:hypothetical protein